MGSIHAYTTASGSRLYRIAYRKPDHSQTNERGFRTKRAAELRLAEVELSKHRGDYVDPSEARITVAMIGTSWIGSRSGDLKPSTQRTIQSARRIHVQPKWGDRQIGSIRHSEIQIWVAALSKTHSATTVRRCHEVLASVLEWPSVTAGLLATSHGISSCPGRSARSVRISATRRSRSSQRSRSTRILSSFSRTPACVGERRRRYVSSTSTRCGVACASRRTPSKWGARSSSERRRHTRNGRYGTRPSSRRRSSTSWPRVPATRGCSATVITSSAEPSPPQAGSTAQ